VWVGGFPATLVVDQALLLCHASPESDCSYLLWNVTPSGAQRRPAAQVQKALEDARVQVVLCGHDHVPFSLRLSTGMLVVNPGSVGLSAYSDDEPYPHVMETGSPHARYAILQKAGKTWEAEHITVSYDWESAAQCAVQNGRRDWAAWLRTGRAQYR
jgi:diadenosine tetraphosphatase ApaH/serine/threonine PP2A family protein phosphatase